VLLLLAVAHLLWASLYFLRTSIQSPAFILAVPGSFAVGAVLLHCVHAGILFWLGECEAVSITAGVIVSSVVA